MAQHSETSSAEQRKEFLEKARRSCEGQWFVLLDNVMDVSRLEMEAGICPVHLESVSVQAMINSMLELD